MCSATTPPPSCVRIAYCEADDGRAHQSVSLAVSFLVHAYFSPPLERRVLAASVVDVCIAHGREILSAASADGVRGESIYI